MSPNGHGDDVPGSTPEGPGDDRDKPLPTPEEVLRTIESTTPDEVRSQEKYQRDFDIKSIETRRRYVHLRGLEAHYHHKGQWSGFLMLLMLGMVVFQSLLLALVGSGRWSFKDYDWLLPALLAQNLAQIVGLAVFVVQALFKDLKDS